MSYNMIMYTVRLLTQLIVLLSLSVDVKNVYSRYTEEFLELSEIASGQFGTVKLSRHRLDGIVYAIKISKHPLRYRFCASLLYL